MNQNLDNATVLEASVGRWTAAELAEQEQTGEIKVSALLDIISDYQEALDAKCTDHKQVLIRAMRMALEHQTPIPEVKACLDAKLIDILGCAACSATKN